MSSIWVSIDGECLSRPRGAVFDGSPMVGDIINLERDDLMGYQRVRVTGRQWKDTIGQEAKTLIVHVEDVRE